MVVQQSLFNSNLYVIDNEKPRKKKRIRFKKPDFIKFYTLYKFDDELYHSISQDVVNKPLCPYNLLRFMNPVQTFFILLYFDLIGKWTRYDEPKYRELCYYKDEDGEKNPLGDEEGIFEIKELHRLHSMLYGYCDVGDFMKKNFEVIRYKGLLIWNEDKQAEIEGTWELPIKERVLLHSRLFELLKQGVELKKAVKIARKAGKL